MKKLLIAMTVAVILITGFISCKQTVDAGDPNIYKFPAPKDVASVLFPDNLLIYFTTVPDASNYIFYIKNASNGDYSQYSLNVKYQSYYLDNYLCTEADPYGNNYKYLPAYTGEGDYYAGVKAVSVTGMYSVIQWAGVPTHLTVSKP